MEVTERINNFSRSVRDLYPLLKERVIPLETQTIIFETVLTPILTYGVESWTIGGRDISRIQAAKMRSLRTMVGKTKRDRLRNENIRRDRYIPSTQQSRFGPVKVAGSI